MANELKPCPFCGSSNLSFRSTPDMDTDGKFHRISCNECGAGSREKFAMETCQLFYEELRNAWNTRPAPAATDTGLETVGYVHEEGLKRLREMRRSTHVVGFINDIMTIPLCLRSQAEKLLAAKEATLQDAIDCVKVLTDEKNKLEADNAAKDARIKEWEKADRLISAALWEKKVEALEAKLAAARKALDRAAYGFDQIHKSLMSNGPKQASGEVTAFFLAETNAALEAKP